MRVFEHPNFGEGVTCPICDTAEDKPTVLVGIDGTEDGAIIEAMQVHLDCLDLSINERRDIIYQIVPREES